MATIDQFLPVESEIRTSFDTDPIIANNSIIMRGEVILDMLVDVRSLVSTDLIVNSMLLGTVEITSGWNPYAIQVNSAIIDLMDIGSIMVNAQVSDRNPVYNSLRVNSTITDSAAITSRQVITRYNIYFDGEDVTDKIQDCKISYSRDNYCGQIDITWKDWTIFPQLDCSDLTTNYRMERFSVYINDVFFGNFYNEKRDVSVNFTDTSPTSWGRTRTALLSPPYATPITPLIKSWNEDEMASSICTYLAGLYGITLQWNILDFNVRAGKFVMNGEYPIDGIRRLAASVGGILTTSRFSPVLIATYKWPV